MKQTARTTGTEQSARSPDEELDVVVGLPAYNEAVGIGSTILTAQEFTDDIVVADDGSSDQTAEVAEAAGATVITHETNQGKGKAVKTLFEHAKARDPEVFVMLDADGQHLPKDIPAVVEPIADGEADIVIGSRYLESGEDDETPLYRRFGQRVLDILTTGSFGSDLTDTQSGFRAFSPTAVEQLDLTTDGIGVESEMIRDATAKDLTVTEVPIDVRYDGVDGQTHHPLSHGFSVINSILCIVRDRHPLLFFGVPGLLLVLAGGLYGLDAVLIYRATGTFYPAKILVSGFVTLFGTLSLFSGLTLHSISYQVEQLSEGN